MEAGMKRMYLLWLVFLLPPITHPSALAQGGQVTQETDAATRHDGKGVGHDRSGRYVEAVGDLQQAIRSRPDSAEAHNNLGVAYNDSGLHLEAVESLSRAI